MEKRRNNIENCEAKTFLVRESSQIEGRVGDGSGYPLLSWNRNQCQSLYAVQEETAPLNQRHHFAYPAEDSAFYGHHETEKKATATATVVTAFVAGSERKRLRPGDRYDALTSAKKNLERGPLKKRSPKFPPGVQSHQMPVVPLSTPTPADTFVPRTVEDMLRSQTSSCSSGFSAGSSSVSSASSIYRRRLTYSVAKKARKGLSYQPLSFQRNLNIQLMTEPLLTTPTEGRQQQLLVSTFTMSPLRSRYSSLTSPIAFSFSKTKSMLSNPVVTDEVLPKAPPDTFPLPPDANEHREQEAEHVSDDNQVGSQAQTENMLSMASNVLRITQPFSRYPRVTKISNDPNPICPPHADAAKTPCTLDAKFGCKETMPKLEIGKIHRRALFSPWVGGYDSSSKDITSFRPSTERPFSGKTAVGSTEPSRWNNEITAMRSSPVRVNIHAPFICGKTVLKPKNETIAMRPVSAESIMPATTFRNTSSSKSENKPTDALILDRPDLFQKVSITNRPCKCRKSKCLKLYCECFHNASFCDPNLCNCLDCMNTESFNSTEEPRGSRILAMLVVLAKRPKAFDEGGRKFNTKGCRCKKNRYVADRSHCNQFCRLLSYNSLL